MNKIEDQNKLIAEFMGVETTSDATNSMYHYEGDSIGRELQYHTSWDWIMPVVMKISRKIDKPLDEVVSLLTEVGSDNIWDVKSLHNAVVEFIKQYNETK
jgi:hypothetical protein